MTKVRISTGIEGLDEILAGGLIKNRNTLLRGPPGAGKTIFGLHFLAAGVENGETSLFLNLGEPSEYVQETAEFFDLNPSEIHFENLSPTQEAFSEEEAYSLFESAEVEQPGYIQRLKSSIEEIEPDRVLLDPITEFRFLTTDERQFRKQILALLDFLKAKDVTVVLTSQAAETVPDEDLQFLTDAVISLDIVSDHRNVEVKKFRGSSFRSGPHAYDIRTSGVAVWPKIQPHLEATELPELKTLSSGVPELDQLLGGGITQGTVTFLSGPTGAGKTTTGVQFLKEAVAQGKKAALYEFEESKHTLLDRSASVNIPIGPIVERGDLSIREIKPDQMTVDEFTWNVKQDVEEEGIDFVIIDGTSGFQQNLRGMSPDPSQDLLRVGRYLLSQGVTVIVPHEIHSITGSFTVTEKGTSNLADTIIFIRHVEYKGQMRKVIGTLKKRTGDFERHLRELEITEFGLSVGDPLPHLRGILSGTPDWADDTTEEAASHGDK